MELVHDSAKDTGAGLQAGEVAQNPVTFSDPTGLYAIGHDRKPDHGTNRAITRARLTAPPPPPDPITVISSFPGEEFYAQPGVSGDEVDEMVAEELELSSPIDVALTRIAWACDRGDDDFKDQHCAKASMDCGGWACGSNQGAKDAFILFVGDPSACKDLGAACIFEVAAAIPALKILKAKEAAMASRAAATGGADLVRVGDFGSNAVAFKHYSKHVKGVVLGKKGKATPKKGGADMPEFGSFAEYRSAARDFMGGGAGPGVLERGRGTDILRVDPNTGYFGVRSQDGTIRTFFRPDGDPVDYFWGQ